MSKLYAVPLTSQEANAFVGQLHRHHAPVHRDKFRLGAARDGELVGVVQIGRPVSRNLDNGRTVEVVRLCSDGSRNVCSFLYGRAAKIAQEMGYDYGRLDENWLQMLHDGFRECMRVLKPDGVLIFKWAETQIPAAEVWKAIGEKPLFGHHSGKKSQTFWGCFMKLEQEDLNDAE